MNLDEFLISETTPELVKAVNKASLELLAKISKEKFECACTKIINKCFLFLWIFFHRIMVLYQNHYIMVTDHKIEKTVSLFQIILSDIIYLQRFRDFSFMFIERLKVDNCL